MVRKEVLERCFFCGELPCVCDGPVRPKRKPRKKADPKPKSEKVEPVVQEQVEVKEPPRPKYDVSMYAALRVLADAGILHRDELKKRPDLTDRGATGKLLKYVGGDDVPAKEKPGE